MLFLSCLVECYFVALKDFMKSTFIRDKFLKFMLRYKISVYWSDAFWTVLSNTIVLQGFYLILLSYFFKLKVLTCDIVSTDKLDCSINLLEHVQLEHSKKMKSS